MTDAMPTGRAPAARAPHRRHRRCSAGPASTCSRAGCNGITTVVLIVAIGWILSWFLNWAVLTANFTASTGSECRGQGACWALIREKFRLIFFGTYPYEQQWRPLFAVVAMLAMLILSADRRMWNWRLAVIWGIGSFVTFLLMFGQLHIPLSLLPLVALAVGLAGMILRKGIGASARNRTPIAPWPPSGRSAWSLRILGILPAWSLPIAPFSYVETSLWGGMPVTMILATYGLAFAFPYGVLLALGRRSNLPLIKGLCVGFIELIRGVPLISLLIMASVMLPLFLPSGVTIDKFLRAQVAVILFAGAYIAEIIRGGLQSLPKGQFEAADAMGLNYVQKTTLIILPQALRVVIPPLDQHLHRLLQGHLAGADHRHLRLPRRGQPGAGRPQLGGLPGRGLPVRRLRLFLLLLLDVALQQVSRGRAQQGNAPLGAARRTGPWPPAAAHDLSNAPSVITLTGVNKWYGQFHVL